ncbi:MAG: pilus (MSHA type) biogenesis protein MshL [Thiobacillus sp.]
MMNAVLKHSVSTGLALVGLVLLGGCVPPQAFDTSPGHIGQPTQPAMPVAPPPAPVKAAPALAPPRPSAPVPTYTVVVNDVPVKDLLFSIARDTQYNIDLHPGIAGRVSLNAVQEPLPAILERIARQADLRYEMNGRTVSIMPDTPYLKTYKMNYVNLSRNTASSIGVASQIAATGSSDITQTGGGAVSTGNNSNTSVITTSNNDYWVELKDNLVNILYATKIENKKSEERIERAALADYAYLRDLYQKNDKAEIADRRDVESVRAAIPQSATPQPGDSEREVIVNVVAGTVSVFATERQHRLVREYLDTVSNASQRQVLIEATIVEVTLKDQYRAGIDWSKALQGTTGWAINTLGGGTNALAGSLTPFIQATYTNTGSNGFTAAIDMLESYGNTKVLSSPKLMALNNQTAMLKVVNNLVYFSVEVTPASYSGGFLASPAVYTTTARAVPVGIVMSVLPQISENGMVSLTVRPTISRKVGDVSDPNPELRDVANLVPVIQVREMESLLQVRSGQTVMLGGLIQDDSNNARDGLPGLSRPEGIGAIFGQHERINSQTELVIFLRPIVVSSPTLESDELRRFQRLLPGTARSTP